MFIFNAVFTQIARLYALSRTPVVASDDLVQCNRLILFALFWVFETNTTDRFGVSNLTSAKLIFASTSVYPRLSDSELSLLCDAIGFLTSTLDVHGLAARFLWV